MILQIWTGAHWEPSVHLTFYFSEKLSLSVLWEATLGDIQAPDSPIMARGQICVHVHVFRRNITTSLIISRSPMACQVIWWSFINLKVDAEWIAKLFTALPKHGLSSYVSGCSLKQKKCQSAIMRMCIHVIYPNFSTIFKFSTIFTTILNFR